MQFQYYSPAPHCCRLHERVCECLLLELRWGQRSRENGKQTKNPSELRRSEGQRRMGEMGRELLMNFPIQKYSFVSGICWMWPCGGPNPFQHFKHFQHSPLAIDARDQDHVAQLLAVHVELHLFEDVVRMIPAPKELVLASGRVQAAQAIVPGQ